MESTDEILTVQEVARLLKICRVKAYNLFNRKNFPCIRIGKSMRVCKKDLMDYVKHNF